MSYFLQNLVKVLFMDLFKVNHKIQYLYVYKVFVLMNNF